MEGMFSCDDDQINLADFCCACTYPLPCICAKCKDTHFAKPSSQKHRYLPLSAKAEITSAKDLTKVQHRLHRLDLTYTELWRVFDTFQKAREDVEATFQEISQMLAEIKNRYLDQINQTAVLYERRINEAMQDNFSNAWKVRDFIPSDPLAALICTHEPGEAANFDFQYQLDERRDLVEQLCQMSWVLPFPGFPSYPEGAFPLQLTLDSGDTNSVLVHPKQTVSEVKFALRRKMQWLSEELYFQTETGLLQTDWSIERCGLTANSRLHLTSKISISVTTVSWLTMNLMVDRMSTVNELLARSSYQPHLKEVFLIYEGSHLNGTSTLAQCGIVNGAVVCVIREIPYMFTISVHMPMEKTQIIKVRNSLTFIAEIKLHVNEEQDLSAEQYSLTFKGRNLNDQMNLAFYGIQEEAILTLVPATERKTKITIENIRQDGKWVVEGDRHTAITSISFDMDLWTPVAILLKKYQLVVIGCISMESDCNQASF